jgi:transposase InsO family protein
MRKSRYVLKFIDDWSIFTWIYFLKFKSKVFACLKHFKELAENQSGKRIKTLDMNNGGEYVNKYVEHICFEVGIKLQHRAPYSP